MFEIQTRQIKVREIFSRQICRVLRRSCKETGNDIARCHIFCIC
jgi:hypothetical protein